MITETPDWEAFVACLKREGTPKRVHHIELFLDQELQDAIVQRFELADGISASDPFRAQKVKLALQRGPVTSWEEFERYPWPDPDAALARSLEWSPSPTMPVGCTCCTPAATSPTSAKT
jgi:hypothetical protein